MSVPSLGSVKDALQFVTVTKNTPELLQSILDLFKNTQEIIIKKIESSSREYEVLLEEEKKPVGFIGYKKKLKNSHFNVKNFYIFESKKVEKSQLESTFLNHIFSLAKKWDAKGIQVSIPETDLERISFFEKHRFSILASHKSKVKKLQYLFSSESSDRKRKREDSFKMPESKKRQKTELSRERSFSSPPRRSFSTSYNPHSEKRTSSLKRTQSFDLLPKPQIHTIPLKKFYLNQILREEKTVEGRINSGMMKNLRPHDEICFFYNEGANKVEARCKILEIQSFSSFKEMLSHYGVKRCLAEAKDLDHGVSIYHRLPGYQERAEKNGVLGIEIKLLKN